MPDLERAKKELELKRVQLGLAGMEYKILEREADIERIQGEMKLQQSRIDELKKELKGANNGN